MLRGIGLGAELLPPRVGVEPVEEPAEEVTPDEGYQGEPDTNLESWPPAGLDPVEGEDEVVGGDADPEADEDVGPGLDERVQGALAHGSFPSAAATIPQIIADGIHQPLGNMSLITHLHENEAQHWLREELLGRGIGSRLW